MSTFICTVCGAPFDGDLRQASAAAFDHTAEHAAPVGKTPSRPPAQPTERARPGETFPLWDKQPVSQREAMR